MSYADLAQHIAAQAGITLRDYHVERACAVVHGAPIERDGVLFANYSPGEHTVSVVVTGYPAA